MTQPSEAQARILEAIELSQAICEVAVVGDWDQVHRLLADRQQILQEGFAATIEPKVAATIAISIQELFAVDQRIYSLLEAARTEAREGLRSLEVERKVQTAYGRG